MNFPSAASGDGPAWLPWASEEWQLHRAHWHNALDGLLNIDNYLDKFFCAGARLSEASKEVLAFRAGSDIPPVFNSLAAAEAWLRRVERWIDNLRNDLRADSVAAPGLPINNGFCHPMMEHHKTQ